MTTDPRWNVQHAASDDTHYFDEIIREEGEGVEVWVPPSAGDPSLYGKPVATNAQGWAKVLADNEDTLRRAQERGGFIPSDDDCKA